MSKKQHYAYGYTKQPYGPGMAKGSLSRYTYKQSFVPLSARAKPVTSYSPSLVPIASRGYRPNPTEKKVYDIAVTTYQVNTTGSFTLLCIPTTGADMTNRVGRKILQKSVYIRGRVTQEATAAGPQTVANSSQQIRFILFVDYQPNGAAPAVTDLLNTASPASQLNINNRDRFKVLKDKCYVFDASAYNTTATSQLASWSRTVYNFKCYKKIDIETIFNATNGGTIADINSGALYMFWIGDQAAGSNTDGNALVSTRVRFLDP